LTDLGSSIAKLLKWAEKGYALTRFGVVARVASASNPGFCSVKSIHPPREEPILDKGHDMVFPTLMAESELFPIRADMIITIANLIAPADLKPKIFGWGGFVRPTEAPTMLNYALPDQTLHWIQWDQNGFFHCNQELLPIAGEEPIVITEAWLDRTAPIKIQQYTSSEQALGEFEEYEERFGGVACGIFIRLVLNYQEMRVIGLSLYGDTDQILPTEK